MRRDRSETNDCNSLSSGERKGSSLNSSCVSLHRVWIAIFVPRVTIKGSSRCMVGVERSPLGSLETIRRSKRVLYNRTTWKGRPKRVIAPYVKCTHHYVMDSRK